MIVSDDAFQYRLEPSPAARPPNIRHLGCGVSRFNLDPFRKAERMSAHARDRGRMVSLTFRLILPRGGREAHRVELEAAQLRAHQGHRAAGDRLDEISPIAEEALARGRLVRTRGSHRQYKHPIKRGWVTVPGKPGDDVAPGTQHSILKQSGLK